MTSAFALPEVRFLADLEPLGNPAGHPVSLPVFARSAHAAAKIAQEVFPRGVRRLRAVRNGARVVWTPPVHDTSASDE